MTRYSKELTDEAKKIFGNIVHSAYYHMEGFDDESEAESSKLPEVVSLKLFSILKIKYDTSFFSLFT